MEIRDTYALLIGANEPRFADATAKFRIFLLNELGYNPNRISMILGSEDEYILGKTALFFERLKRESQNGNAVILYCGHGGQGTFYPHGRSLSYRDWARFIDHEGNFVFINESCYSGSAIDSFREIGLLPDRGLVITSCARNEKSHGTTCFLDKLIECYLDGEVFRRKKIGEHEYNIVITLSFITPPKGEKLFGEETVVRHSGNRKVIDPRLSRYGYVGTQRSLQKPRIKGKIQHPQRAGKTLDYILFKQ
ncbi:MAG: hypothetical protein AABX33_04240 [Nanoarchaeota archaeon]